MQKKAVKKHANRKNYKGMDGVVSDHRTYLVDKERTDALKKMELLLNSETTLLTT